jgi:hypothetical protein
MTTIRSGRLLAFLMLTALLLTACQIASIEITKHTDEPDQTTPPPAEAATNAPVSEPTKAISETAPSEEGSFHPSAEMQVPEGWQVLEDSTRGYSLAFPPEWNVCQVTRYSWTFCDIQEDPDWAGSPLRLYVSVFPKDYTNSDFEVYNFIPTVTIREFIALPVGESKPKVPGSPRPDTISYTRLPDQTVAGLTAPVIENSKLWGMPTETKERVVFMVTEDTTYILGTYYDTPDQLALFEQVMDSFQFLP